mmetsp:Transcript_24716/g.58037  ORF Transcript_24716/g.58037 Transcript_24716/m.58037 type:complete len:320 (-) Transcript_24716:138-1097(-)|eukprot:CAMPEP_0197173822 /NCGR_PEP_ID=MMETSP1423-20130617/604_1 /TAXON_ID=476441 /ORGANISM="Pseudo-nitzschia heimii, Strain UNC1101" /LENGTH=319 /DNA_ID=CAMNT_0042622687 /DNA_START=91 /DNA_END=1050 /DNA_ORIENTATION=+
MASDRVVGLMDNAYFVGRHELLSFFNELLDLQLSKIEQTATGAVACQITEYIFPGSIPLSRINWEARSDYEFVANYKLLQAAFAKNNVQRFVDVTKLIRAKYQDNLEFCQWLKAFFDQSGAYREDYDPIAVRARGKGGKKFNDSMNKASTKSRSSKPNRPTYPVKSRSATRQQRPPGQRKAPLQASENQARPVQVEKFSKNHTSKATADTELVKKNAELESKISELENVICDIEKERDFYFGKLRSIELFLQIKQDQNWEDCNKDDLVGNTFKVLYATVDDDVFVDDDGEIMPVLSRDPEVIESIDSNVIANEDGILSE